MPAEFTLSEGEYERAVRLGSPLAPWRIAVLATMAVVLVGCVILGSPIVQFSALAGLLSLVVVVAASRLFLLGYLARRTYRKYKVIQMAMRAEFKPEGLALDMRDAHGLLRWENVLKWRQNDEFVLIYQAPQLFHSVPKSIASQGFDLDGFVKALETHVGPAASGGLRGRQRASEMNSS